MIPTVRLQYLYTIQILIINHLNGMTEQGKEHQCWTPLPVENNEALSLDNCDQKMKKKKVSSNKK